MTPEQFKDIVEAAIFAANEPLGIDRLLQLFEENERPEKDVLINALNQLTEDYRSRPVQLIEVSSGFRFQVKSDVAPWVSRLWEEKPQKYSRALLETLALVAYRQPITRGEIEEIRGVAVSTQIIKSLQERDWVRVVGHRDVPGRPSLYATTRGFLDYFGLKSLEELPPLSEIKDISQLDIAVDELAEQTQMEALADEILHHDAGTANALGEFEPDNAEQAMERNIDFAIDEIDEVTDFVELDDADLKRAGIDEESEALAINEINDEQQLDHAEDDVETELETGSVESH